MGYKSRTQFYERYQCKYTKGYLSRVISGDKVVSDELNAEMNRIWQECNLTFEDLELVYVIADQINDTNKNIKNLRRKKK